jgi:putative glycosyltransferase (TIGR04372 family)
MKTTQPWLALRRRQIIHLAFIVTGAVLNILPRRLVFLLLVVCDIAALPVRRRLGTAYQPSVVSFLAHHPDGYFAGPLGRRFPLHSARVLFDIGAYRETCDLILEQGLAISSAEMTGLLTLALFELGEFKKARDASSIRASGMELQSNPHLGFLKSMLDLIDQDEAAALTSLAWASHGMPRLMRPHQNIAARAISQYVPNYLDVLCGSPGRLYDLCNFAGQRVTHVGHGDIGVRLFERALAAQSELRALPRPKLSPELTRLLDEMGIPFDELRIIPEEWTTQIGHLGMLDILFRMQGLGWWSGKPLMVVRSSLVANSAFFRLFESFAKLLVLRENERDPVGEELLSLQRWCGMNFNAFRLPNGDVVPWQEAGARAIAEWEKEGRGNPLRDEYDRIFGRSYEVAEGFDRVRERWGMKPEDWYVCLHIRDAAHYFELTGTGQTHRNSPIEDYLDAIRFITGKGGWVIKLGGRNSPKLPAMDRTVDYAFSEFKSDLLDIHLIRNARAFIGTTSGLTNVAISFGLPSAIVNCITTDSQLWNQRVRFALKPVRFADGKMLTQRQLTSAPWRWRVFDAAVLSRSGGHLHHNTADEICVAVREVEALASGRSAEFESEYDAETLLSRWKDQLALPHYYGTSRPSLNYLKKYEAELLADADGRTVSGDAVRARAVNA